MLIPSDCFHGTLVPRIMRDLTPKEVIGLLELDRIAHRHDFPPYARAVLHGVGYDRVLRPSHINTPYRTVSPDDTNIDLLVNRAIGLHIGSTLDGWLDDPRQCGVKRRAYVYRADEMVRISRSLFTPEWTIAEQRAEKL